MKNIKRPITIIVDKLYSDTHNYNIDDWTTWVKKWTMAIIISYEKH
jgi:hypothetical protein